MAERNSVSSGLASIRAATRASGAGCSGFDTTLVSSGTFEARRAGGGLAANLLEDGKLLITELGPPAHVGQQRAQLHPPLRVDGGLQNLAHLGLHAAAVSGGPPAQRPVHLFGKVAHCQHRHLRPHPVAINACMMLPCLHPGPPDGRERQWPGTGRAAGVRLLPSSTPPAWMPADARAYEFAAMPPKLRPAPQATPQHPPRLRLSPPPSTLGGPQRPSRSRIPAIESGHRAAQPQQETAS